MNFIWLCTARPVIPKADLTSEMYEAPFQNRFLSPALRNSDSVILGWSQESVFLTRGLGFLVK